MAQKNGSELALHFHPYSFYSQKVIMSLYQKNLSFRPIYVDIHRGKQFSEKFLSLNPKGEVPVLVDDVLVIPDSEHIIDYLEDNFSNGSPRLRPADHDLRQRVDQLHQLIHQLKVDALTFGTVVYDDLELNPKPPYNNPTTRSQIKTLVEHGASMLRTEIEKHPSYADTLTKKLQEIRENTTLWLDRKKYLDLILSFEKVMDECEAELQSHDDNSWWLCSPDISIADISFSILLHRLWLLGFERMMWERSRPFIKRYYARVQQLDSFKQATNMPGGNALVDILTSPFFWGFLGVVAVAGGGFYLWKNQGKFEWFSNNKTEAGPLSKGSGSSNLGGSNMRPRIPNNLQRGSVGAKIGM